MHIPNSVKPMIRGFTTIHVFFYRLLRGQLPGNWLGKFSILISTIGRKSGQLRTTPLFALRDGADYIVVASYGGSDHDPIWYRNIQANPRVLVNDHGLVHETLARDVLDINERSRLWVQLLAMYPTYDTYRQNSNREFPLVRLSPRQ
jgi:deazaflavin-dependent oxidoreductase (nitroreductase family)